MMKTKST